MKARKILIAGASIAGPTLAYWLHRYGFEVTVVERSPALRLGGQNIDVKGAAREIVRRMGIEGEILAANTGEIGVQFINRHNRIKAAFPKGNGGGLTSELEILRGDLVSILYEHTKADVDYQFGKYITAITQSDSGAEVTFSNQERASFDLVIAADGVRSTTRQLMFGNEAKTKYLGLYTVYLTIPKTESDTQWARWYNAPQSRVILLRPDNKGTTRASFNFLSKDNGYEKLSAPEKKQLLQDRLAGAGWEGPRLAAAIAQNNDIYFDTVSQIKAPRWHNGRLAMIGDAAYCPTPISGMGTALAITGAYLLAGELSRHDDYAQAFAAYEKRMRPYVNSAQRLPPGVPWIVYPKTRLGVAILNRLIGIVASKPVQSFFKLFSKGDDAGKDKIVLPDYGNQSF